MSRSQSSPDIYKVSVTRTSSKSLDEELLELCNLSGVTLDPDVFKILLDLIKLNVPPPSLVTVLKQVASTKGYRSEGHPTLSAKSSTGSTGSAGSATGYESLQSSQSTIASGSSLGSTQSPRLERIPISSRLREMKANAIPQ